MTVPDFLVLGHTDWLECHWTIARTQEQAELWFKLRGLSGKFYRICHNKHSKGSDGFFAWWMPIK